MNKFLLTLATAALLTPAMTAQTAKFEGPIDGVIKVTWEGVNTLSWTNDAKIEDSEVYLRLPSGKMGTLNMTQEMNNTDAPVCIVNSVTPNYLNINISGSQYDVDEAGDYQLRIAGDYVYFDGVVSNTNAFASFDFTIGSSTTDPTPDPVKASSITPYNGDNFIQGLQSVSISWDGKPLKAAGNDPIEVKVGTTKTNGTAYPGIIEGTTLKVDFNGGLPTTGSSGIVYVTMEEGILDVDGAPNAAESLSVNGLPGTTFAGPNEDSIITMSMAGAVTMMTNKDSYLPVLSGGNLSGNETVAADKCSKNGSAYPSILSIDLSSYELEPGDYTLTVPGSFVRCSYSQYVYNFTIESDDPVVMPTPTIVTPAWPSQVIYINFEEAVEMISFQEAAKNRITIDDQKLTPTKVTLSDDGKTMTIDPSNVFLFNVGKEYTLTVPAGYLKYKGEPIPEIKTTFNYEAPEKIYVLGEFNNYTENEDYTVKNLEETIPAEYGGLFEIAEGKFDFYLKTGDTYIGAVANKGEMSADDTQFTGTFVTATSADGLTHWTCTEWPGGSIDFNVDLDKKSVTAYLSPKKPFVTNDDYTISFEEGIISIIWEDVDQVVTALSEGSYIADAEGNETPLTNRKYNSESGAYVGQIAIDYSGPGLTVYTESLELEPGEYKLFIPQGYTEIEWDTYSVTGTNPDIEYNFTIEAVYPEVIYVYGAFNNYQESADWTIKNLDEAAPAVLGNVLNIPEGEFEFYLGVNGKYYGATSGSSEVSLDSNKFTASYEESDDSGAINKWTCAGWPGGMADINIDLDKKTVTFYLIPNKQAQTLDDYSTVFDKETQIVTFTWDDMYSVSLLDTEGAYVEGESQIALTNRRYSSDDEAYFGNIKVYDAGDDVMGVEVYLEDLNLEPGDYTLFIPQGYLELNWDNTNPDIEYNFTIEADDNSDDNNGDNNGGGNGDGESDGWTGIDGVNADNNARYFTLQGIEVKNPVKGIYIKVEGNEVTRVAIR